MHHSIQEYPVKTRFELEESIHMSENANIIYFSHGGGPLPLMGDESHRAMIEFMKKLPDQLP